VTDGQMSLDPMELRVISEGPISDGCQFDCHCE